MNALEIADEVALAIAAANPLEAKLFEDDTVGDSREASFKAVIDDQLVTITVRLEAGP